MNAATTKKKQRLFGMGLERDSATKLCSSLVLFHAGSLQLFEVNYHNKSEKKQCMLKSESVVDWLEKYFMSSFTASHMCYHNGFIVVACVFVCMYHETIKHFSTHSIRRLGGKC